MISGSTQTHATSERTETPRNEDSQGRIAK